MTHETSWASSSQTGRHAGCRRSHWPDVARRSLVVASGPTSHQDRRRIGVDSTCRRDLILQIDGDALGGVPPVAIWQPFANSEKTPNSPKPHEEKEAPPGFEPGMVDLQSTALATWRRRQWGLKVGNSAGSVKGNKRLGPIRMNCAVHLGDSKGSRGT